MNTKGQTAKASGDKAPMMLMGGPAMTRAVDQFLEKNSRTLKGNKVSDVMNPLFNVRQIALQMLLLEDHLCHTDKRCNDCIRKHFATIEAFAEEALTLDKEGKYPFLKLLPPAVRGLQESWGKGVRCEVLQQQIRVLRKPLLKHSFSVRGSILRIGTLSLEAPKRSLWQKFKEGWNRPGMNRAA